MRFSAYQILLILAFTTLTYAYDVSGQELLDRRISVQLSGVTPEQALLQVSRATGIPFMYNPRIFRKDMLPSLEFREERLSDVLDAILKQEAVRYEVAGKRVILKRNPEKIPQPVSIPVPLPAEKPARLISGDILDDKGAGIPGATVRLKDNAAVGTTTNAEGHFTLTVPDGPGTLLVSSVGYQPKEVPIGSQTVLRITLDSDTKALTEVVVVGYGQQSRREVTGSVAKIPMAQTENLPNTNISQALRGRVAGVQFTDSGRPGQGGSIMVRGRRSITANNDPLIVLDGIFFNGSLADINPNDIESMEILKDASAAAIYGSRAANGVILITSKRGKSDKPTIRVNSFYGFSNWSNRVKLLTPERYIQKTLDYRAQNGQDADPSQINMYLQNTEVENYKAGRTIDPWDVVSQKAGMQSYDLSIAGQSGRTNYLVSGAFVDEQGLIYMDKAKRITLRSNLENKVTDWLTVGLNATFAQRDLSGVDVAMNWASQLSPFAKMWYDDAQTDPVRFPQDVQLVPNPLFNSLRRSNSEVYNNLFSNFYAKVDLPFLKGLSYRVNYSPNYRWNHNYLFEPAYQRNGDNILSNASKYNTEVFDWVLENIATYQKQLNENHSFDVTLLYGRNHSQSESTTATASNFFNGANGWNNLGLAQVQQTTSGASMVDGVSSMLRLNYRFRDRYLLTLTARRDGSSVFGANNKYATFPSAALAWIASDEPFLKTISAIDMLKVRLSYGSVGNQAISPYQSLSRSGTAQYVFGDGSPTYTGTYPSGMANTDLKWETTTSANAAIDFDLFKGRIGGTIEYYSMNTKNLLLNRSIPTPNGFSTVITNLGATSNRGMEFTLNTLNIKQGPWEWSSNLVFSVNKNKIVHIYRRDTNGDGREDDDLGNRWFIGQPIRVAYDYKIDGVYQEGDQLPTGYKPGFYRLKDINGDGKITTDDRAVLGQTDDPQYRWGFTNTLKYKQFTLSVFVNSLSGWIANYSQMIPSNNFPGSAANFPDNGWWTAENKSNKMSSLVYTNPYGHGYYVSRNFVRVQDIALSYEFPQKLVKSWKMSNLRAFVSGKNLLTFTDWPGFDPESGSTASGFPMPRSFTGGLNISF